MQESEQPEVSKADFARAVPSEGAKTALRVWPFPLLRNYQTSDALTELFFAFAARDDLKVAKPDAHYMTLTCSMGRLTFWDANRWYAWASEGVFSTDGGGDQRWSGEMPSRAAVRAMRQAIDFKRFRFNLRESASAHTPNNKGESV